MRSSAGVETLLCGCEMLWWKAYRRGKREYSSDGVMLIGECRELTRLNHKRELLDKQKELRGTV